MSGSDTVALTLLGAIGGANASLSMLQAIYGQTNAGAPRGDPLTGLK